MNPLMRQVLKSKKELRELPRPEKARLVKQMRDAAKGTPSQFKSFTQIARHLAETFPDTEVFPEPPPRPPHEGN
jgi:hypothetical protein